MHLLMVCMPKGDAAKKAQPSFPPHLSALRQAVLPAAIPFLEDNNLSLRVERAQPRGALPAPGARGDALAHALLHCLASGAFYEGTQTGASLAVPGVQTLGHCGEVLLFFLGGG